MSVIKATQDMLKVIQEQQAERIFICMRCKTPNTFWTYLCESCDAKAASEDTTMDSDD